MRRKMGLMITIRCFVHLLFLLSISLITNTQKLANISLKNGTNQISDVLPEILAHVPTHFRSQILKAFIQEEGQPIIELRWKKTKQVVANRHLPVWGAQSGDTHGLKSKNAEKILKHFIMYQDSEHDSAVVYVTNKELIYGNVGTKYYIHGLPIRLLWKKTVFKVNGPYVKRNPNFNNPNTTTPVEVNTLFAEIDSGVNTINHTHEKLFNEFIVKTVKKASESVQAVFSESRIEKEKTKAKFYVETLLFITHDIVNPIKSAHPDNYLFHILLHYTVYFNSIDMLLAKLPMKFRLFINLAGVIYEENPDVFSSVIKSSILDYEERNKSLALEGFARLFSKYYLLDPHFVMPENSFDLVFISTSRELEFEGVKVLGQSFGGVDLYSMRQAQPHQMIGIPKTIARNSDVFTSFVVGAHEIGNVFAYQNLDEEYCIEESQPQLLVCDHCLEWSSDIIQGIEKFMRENRNRCWLLNHPRSLRPNNASVIVQFPTKQCQCYGYIAYGEKNSTTSMHVPYNACERALPCVKIEKQNTIVEPTILPFDGTPCERDRSKVCWRQKCVKVSYQKKSRL